MKLSNYPHAPYSRKVLLAAYEKEVAFESVVCPPFDREAKEALKRVHPLATVPLLVADDGEVMTESSIIIEYLDQVSTRGPELLPSDRRAALRARAFDRFSDSNLMGPTAYLAWALRKPVETQNTEKIAAQRKTLETALALADAALGKHAFCAGDAITIADLSPAAAISCQLSDKTIPGLDAWPNVKRWFEAMKARPSFVRIFEDCTRVPLPPGF